MPQNVLALGDMSAFYLATVPLLGPDLVSHKPGDVFECGDQRWVTRCLTVGFILRADEHSGALHGPELSNSDLASDDQDGGINLLADEENVDQVDRVNLIDPPAPIPSVRHSRLTRISLMHIATSTSHARQAGHGGAMPCPATRSIEIEYEECS
jgi:hypothetical protein